MMRTKERKSRRGFWTGLFVGLFLAWTYSALRLDLNRVFRAMYNLMAPNYDVWVDRLTRGGLPGLRQELVDRLELKAGDHVLEVAIGTGANMPYMAERIGPAGKIYGIDISEGMLAQAEKKVDEIPCPVELRWGNAEDLPYPDNHFDAVLNFGAMNFITDRRKAIEEMVRVAKPGAKIVLGDETVVPDGLLQGLLARIVLLLIPRLRPPIDLVPGQDAHLTNLVPEQEARLTTLTSGSRHVAQNIYVIEWRKPVAVSEK